jgi:hypothetical protein
MELYEQHLEDARLPANLRKRFALECLRRKITGLEESDVLAEKEDDIIDRLRRRSSHVTRKDPPTNNKRKVGGKVSGGKIPHAKPALEESVAARTRLKLGNKGKASDAEVEDE